MFAKKLRRIERYEAGVCRDCSSPRDSEWQLCAACREKAHSYRVARWARDPEHRRAKDERQRRNRGTSREA